MRPKVGLIITIVVVGSILTYQPNDQLKCSCHLFGEKHTNIGKQRRSLKAWYFPEFVTKTNENSTLESWCSRSFMDDGSNLMLPIFMPCMKLLLSRNSPPFSVSPSSLYDTGLGHVIMYFGTNGTACSKMRPQKYQELPLATWSCQLCYYKNMPWGTVGPEEGETWGKSVKETCSLRQNHLNPGPMSRCMRNKQVLNIYCMLLIIWGFLHVAWLLQ